MNSVEYSHRSLKKTIMPTTPAMNMVDLSQSDSEMRRECTLKKTHIRCMKIRKLNTHFADEVCSGSVYSGGERITSNSTNKAARLTLTLPITTLKPSIVDYKLIISL